MFEQRVVRVQISITKKFSKSFSLIVTKELDKSTLMEISQVLRNL